MNIIVNAIYQHDGLCFVSEDYKVFNDSLNIKRGQNESMKGLKHQF